ncbi:hypothetical protein AAMO2058_001073700 [Amorphochlora amoebiformis]
MAKKRRVPSGKTRPRRKKNIRSEVLAEPDESARTSMDGDDVFSQALGGDFVDSADLLSINSLLLTSLQKNVFYWIILGITVSVSLSWITYIMLVSTGMLKGFATVEMFNSDAIAFYHPSHKSYVACVEKDPLKDPKLVERRRARYKVKEALDVFQDPSTDSDLIALAEPGDIITILERNKDWIRHSRGLVVEGWSKLDRYRYNGENGEEGIFQDSNPNNVKEPPPLQIEHIHSNESLVYFLCFCAAGSRKGNSKLVSPYELALNKTEIPAETLRIPLFAHSALYKHAEILGSDHGCIWCSDALLLGLSPIIWTFVNLPLGLFISFGTMLSDLFSIEVGEMWSLVILCTGFLWFFLCLLATYVLELRSASNHLMNNQRWWLQVQFVARPILDLIVLCVGVFFVGPCLAIPTYIFLLIRFYSIPSNKPTSVHAFATSHPTLHPPSSHPGANTNPTSSPKGQGPVSPSDTVGFNSDNAEGGDEGIYRDDTQVIYTCSLLRDRFLTDHVIMSSLFISTCFTSHAFSTWGLYPNVRWIAIPQLYQFYCILKRGTPDSYIVICFAWQSLGVAFALRTGGLISYVVYVIFCKDFDHPKAHMPWREHTLKQIAALGAFSLACGSVGVIPALLMFLTTLAKNPRAYLSANKEEIEAARIGEGEEKKQDRSGIKESPDYCRVIADFLVKLGLVLMARALVSEFRCSRWLDYNLANFIKYGIDIEIDNRAHVSLLTILGGGVATSIARRNWIPNLCAYAAAGRRALEILVFHEQESYESGFEPSPPPEAKSTSTSQRRRQKGGSKRASCEDRKSSPPLAVPGGGGEGRRGGGHDSRWKKNNGGPRIRFVSTVERFLTDPNVKTFTLGVILIVSLIKGWPVMCVLPLLQPEPYESLLGPSFWNLTVFIWTVTTRAPRQFLALTDTLILGLGFVAWALKDYNETQMVEDQMEFQMYGENEGKLSVAQKLKIGLEDRAVVGDVKAQFQMANLYAREGDILKATDWYRQAANHGNKEAQIALADCYAMGKGVARDEKMAVWWYEKAADQGVADAKIRLAMITDASNNVSVPSPSPHGLPMETKSSGPSVDIVDSKHMPVLIPTLTLTLTLTRTLTLTLT